MLYKLSDSSFEHTGLLLIAGKQFCEGVLTFLFLHR